MLHKKNTFYDFIDAARFLVKENYTSPEHLYAMGGSAGGLLIGAVMNEAPELFCGIVAQVPFGGCGYYHAGRDHSTHHRRI